MKKPIKPSDEEATNQVVAGVLGGIGPRYAGYDGDNCGCSGVMVLIPKHPSQELPEGTTMQFQCGLCGRITYQ